MGGEGEALLASSKAVDKVDLKPEDSEALLQILRSIPPSKEVLSFMEKLSVLPPEFDTSKLIPLLLQDGQVKLWMMSAVEKGDKNSLFLWGNIIRILGKTLHMPGDGTLLINSLLHVAEKAFKHSNNEIRVAAYKAWIQLMDNFALNHSVLISKKRIKLIVRPLVVRKNVFLYTKANC